MADTSWMKGITEEQWAQAIRNAPADSNSLYNELFGRDIDEAGAEFYDSKNLTSGELRDILMASEEREYTLDAANPDVDRAFNDYLSRDAGQAGEEFYKDMTYDEIVAAIQGEQFDEKWAGDPMSEYERYRAGADPETYRGGEYGGTRPLYTESDYNDEFRNPDTNPYTPEELEGVSAKDRENRDKWASTPPWWDSNLSGSNIFRNDGGVRGIAQPYQSTFERQETHGGMGNQELYDTQFSNLLGQQNDFQKQQQFAQGIRQDNAAKAPTGAPVDPWSWYNEGKGLPDRTTPAAGAPAAAPAAGAGAGVQLTPQQQAAIAASIGNIGI